jgi:hypothetical protein
MLAAQTPWRAPTLASPSCNPRAKIELLSLVDYCHTCILISVAAFRARHDSSWLPKSTDSSQTWCSAFWNHPPVASNIVFFQTGSIAPFARPQNSLLLRSRLESTPSPPRCFEGEGNHLPDALYVLVSERSFTSDHSPLLDAQNFKGC